MRAVQVSMARHEGGLWAAAVPEQRDSGQRAWTWTALSVPLSDPHWYCRRRGRQRSCRTRSGRQWQGQWRGAGWEGVGVENVSGAGAKAVRRAGQRQQRVSVLLSLDGDRR